MKYKQIKQTSRPYEYGRGKEFETKEDAQENIKELRQKIMTHLSLERLYDKSKVDVIEVEGAFQIVITTKIPIIVEQAE